MTRPEHDSRGWMSSPIWWKIDVASMVAIWIALVWLAIAMRDARWLLGLPVPLLQLPAVLSLRRWHRDRDAFTEELDRRRARAAELGSSAEVDG